MVSNWIVDRGNSVAMASRYVMSAHETRRRSGTSRPAKCRRRRPTQPRRNRQEIVRTATMVTIQRAPQRQTPIFA